MTPFLFFDLDGPLLDVSDKYYRVYRDILESWSKPVLDKEDFWQAKRSKASIADILHRTGAEGEQGQYAALRVDRIESEPFWRYDKLQPGAIECLAQIGGRFRRVLVTLRKSRAELENELERFGLAAYFEAVLTSGVDSVPRWRVKYDLVIEHLGSLPPVGSWFVGDTDTDILAGKELGCRTVGVLNGIRNRRLLEEAAPDFVIEDVRSLAGVIGAAG